LPSRYSRKKRERAVVRGPWQENLLECRLERVGDFPRFRIFKPGKNIAHRGSYERFGRPDQQVFQTVRKQSKRAYGGGIADDSDILRGITVRDEIRDVGELSLFGGGEDERSVFAERGDPAVADVRGDPASVPVQDCGRKRTGKRPQGAGKTSISGKL